MSADDVKSQLLADLEGHSAGAQHTFNWAELDASGIPTMRLNPAEMEQLRMAQSTNTNTTHNDVHQSSTIQPHSENLENSLTANTTPETLNTRAGSPNRGVSNANKRAGSPTRPGPAFHRGESANNRGAGSSVRARSPNGQISPNRAGGGSWRSTTTSDRSQIVTSSSYGTERRSFFAGSRADSIGMPPANHTSNSNNNNSNNDDDMATIRLPRSSVLHTTTDCTPVIGSDDLATIRLPRGGRAPDSASRPLDDTDDMATIRLPRGGGGGRAPDSVSRPIDDTDDMATIRLPRGGSGGGSGSGDGRASDSASRPLGNSHNDDDMATIRLTRSDRPAGITTPHNNNNNDNNNGNNSVDSSECEDSDDQSNVATIRIPRGTLDPLADQSDIATIRLPRSTHTSGSYMASSGVDQSNIATIRLPQRATNPLAHHHSDDSEEDTDDDHDEDDDDDEEEENSEANKATVRVTSPFPTFFSIPATLTDSDQSTGDESDIATIRLASSSAQRASSSSSRSNTSQSEPSESVSDDTSESSEQGNIATVRLPSSSTPARHPVFNHAYLASGEEIEEVNTRHISNPLSGDALSVGGGSEEEIIEVKSTSSHPLVSNPLLSPRCEQEIIEATPMHRRMVSNPLAGSADDHLSRDALLPSFKGFGSVSLEALTPDLIRKSNERIITAAVNANLLPTTTNNNHSNNNNNNSLDSNTNTSTTTSSTAQTGGMTLPTLVGPDGQVLPTVSGLDGLPMHIMVYPDGKVIPMAPSRAGTPVPLLMTATGHPVRYPDGRPVGIEMLPSSLVGLPADSSLVPAIPKWCSSCFSLSSSKDAASAGDGNEYIPMMIGPDGNPVFGPDALPVGVYRLPDGQLGPCISAPDGTRVVVMMMPGPVGAFIPIVVLPLGPHGLPLSFSLAADGRLVSVMASPDGRMLPYDHPLGSGDLLPSWMQSYQRLHSFVSPAHSPTLSRHVPPPTTNTTDHTAPTPTISNANNTCNNATISSSTDTPTHNTPTVAEGVENVPVIKLESISSPSLKETSSTPSPQVLLVAPLTNTSGSESARRRINSKSEIQGQVPSDWGTLRPRKANQLSRPKRKERASIETSVPLVTSAPGSETLKSRAVIQQEISSLSAKRHQMKLKDQQKKSERLQLKQQKELKQFQDKMNVRTQVAQAKLDSEIEAYRAKSERDQKAFEKQQDKQSKTYDGQFEEETRNTDAKQKKITLQYENKFQETKKREKQEFAGRKAKLLQDLKRDLETKQRNKYTFDKKYIKKMKFNQKLEILLHEKIHVNELEFLKLVSDHKLLLEQQAVACELVNHTSKELAKIELTMLRERNANEMAMFDQLLDNSLQAMSVFHQEEAVILSELHAFQEAQFVKRFKGETAHQNDLIATTRTMRRKAVKSQKTMTLNKKGVLDDIEKETQALAKSAENELHDLQTMQRQLLKQRFEDERADLEYRQAKAIFDKNLEAARERVILLEKFHNSERDLFQERKEKDRRMLRDTLELVDAATQKGQMEAIELLDLKRIELLDLIAKDCKLQLPDYQERLSAFIEKYYADRIASVNKEHQVAKEIMKKRHENAVIALEETFNIHSANLEAKCALEMSEFAQAVETLLNA